MPRNNRRVLNQDSLETITDLAEGLRFLLAFLARRHLKSRLNFPGELGTHFCLLLSCPIENFCKNMHFFSIDQKIWHFLSKYHNTSKIICAALPLISTFRLIAFSLSPINARMRAPAPALAHLNIRITPLPW